MFPRAPSGSGHRDRPHGAAERRQKGGAETKRRATASTAFALGESISRRPAGRYDLVAGLTPGLSLKNCLFSSMKFFQLAGVSSSAKIAFTGQTGSHAPQSMHSSGGMERIVSPP